MKQAESWDFSESITAPRLLPAALHGIAVPLPPMSASEMNPAEDLRILLIEDSVVHAEMVALELKRHGLVFRSRRVDTRDGLCDALLHFVPDLVLSDLTMPSFSGVEGLRITREKCPNVPFIFFSGTIDEKRGIELLREGATDYVNKVDLARLAFVVERALRDARAQREQRRTDTWLGKLSCAVEHSPSAVVVTDGVGMIEYVNPNFAEVSGYSAEELIGQNTRILSSGETLPSVYEEMWRTIRSGGEWRGELHNRRKNGDLFWEFASISPIRDDTGVITHFVAVKEDITERKKLEEQLRRAQRLETIGTLASGLAHDLNNILAPILMSLPLLEKALAGKPEASAVSIVAQCAERGAGIVRQVLTLASGIEGGQMFVQVGHILSEIVKIMTETFPRSITIRSNVPAHLWSINADATQLHQLLLNLCVNARDAMPAGGFLRIEASNVEIDENYAAMSADAKPGPYLAITVSDTGQGIPAEIVRKIFEPFFTTKETGKGTGLGLFTVLGIVKGHGGFLTVKSRPGEGTSFKVFLPADRKRPAAIAPAARTPCGNGELILLVDDEESILAIGQDVLQAHGYHVLIASDGIEALSLFAQRRDEIAAVVTDIAMPLMDGIALAGVLRRMKPALCLIVSTGDSDKSQISSLDAKAVLSKPYDSATLLQALHKALVDPDRPPLLTAT